MSKGRGVIRWMLAAPLMVLVAAGYYQKSVATAGNGQEQDFTIRTTSRLVLLDVSVKGKDGGFVSGLAQDNFKVYENGKLQQITQFANADIPVRSEEHTSELQ